MAQIRIEEKKKGSILPWILGLLLLGLLIWGVAEAFEESDEVLTEEVDAIEEPVNAVNSDVEDYDYGYRDDIEAYVDYTMNMQGEMGLDHEFSHKALSLLAAATTAIADGRNVDIRDKSDNVMKLADDITKDPYATDHADKIRMAALNIVDMMEEINTKSFDGAATAKLTDLRREAQDINAKTLTLNQKEDVRSFFGKARDILSGMM